jgi:hypothetical protein
MALKEKRPRKRGRRTSFVPSVIFGTAALGVIPACALGCGGGSSTKTYPMVGVAIVGYCPDSGCPAVAVVGFDAGLDSGSEAGSEAGTGADAVAFVGFDAGLDSGDKG